MGDKEQRKFEARQRRLRRNNRAVLKMGEWHDCPGCGTHFQSRALEASAGLRGTPLHEGLDRLNAEGYGFECSVHTLEEAGP